MIDYWNSMGYTSTKAYNQITGAELKAAIEESHKLHMKITGHLCSVGFAQAVELGIDNLEHGPFAAPDGDLYVDKVEDECAAKTGGDSRVIGAAVVAGVEPTGQELKQTIRLMIEHHVALTSTLAVLEGGEELDLERNGRLKELLHPVAWDRIHELHRLELARGSYYANLLKKEMAFERAFVAQGGQLMFGCDPTGDGHTIAGLGDQRSLELLVQAGFTVPEVIQIATLNGAKFEGLADRLGTIAKGKRADLVVLDGNLAENFLVIESPLLVFKAGTEYDSHKIYESLKGQVGLH
jgi:imidazolonepropionase-like amidohydrolase